MRKLIRAFSIFTVSILVITSCQKDQTDSKIQQDGILTVKNAIINNNSESFSDRISYKDEIVPVKQFPTNRLKGLDSAPVVDLTKNYVFKLKAEVDAPVYEGSTLQATHVAIHEHYAFVTFNTKGPDYLGGVEVFDVTDLKNPVIISQAIFPKADVSSVDYANGKLFIVGANGEFETMGYSNPAFLEVLSLNENHEITSVDTIIGLSSYVGTDVLVTGGKIYTTSGSDGGLTVFDATDYSLIKSVDISDARSVASNDNYVYVLQGQDGRVNVFTKSDVALQSVYEVGGANTPESKSELAVRNEYILAALNEGGTEVLKSDGTLQQHIARPETPEGELSENHVTNSVSLNGDLVLLGNGESGVYVGGMVTEQHDSILMLGSMQFEASQSTNFVESRDDVIFVATGLGGLKILGISIDEGVPDDIIPTQTCTFLSDEISSLFPEGEDNTVKYPELFNDTAVLNITTTAETPVYVTFVDEGAGWKNTFGYYAYPANDPPTTVEDLQKHIVFPNVSKVGDGGGLEAGDMVQLGDKPFPANTVIGFYMVARGWQNGLTTDGIYTHYTNTEFNTNNNQQSTLFINNECNDLVLTFEDVYLRDGFCDHDYNDIILVIKDNPDVTVANTNFDVSRIPKK
ncbi:MAG TPA: DUF4114 domain-containing protein [Bacteroidales bacterium]|nr:DUF4114 domain-containing protein [Bacteroidales bacterium]